MKKSIYNKLITIKVIITLIYLFNIGPDTARASNIQRRLFKELPQDNKSAIQYLGQGFSPEQYNESKKNELAIFRKDLKKMYNLDFKMRSTKYFNIAYRCPDEKMNFLQDYLTKFFEQVYPRYFIYEPSSAFRVVYFESKELYEKLTGMLAYGFYSPQTGTLTTYAYSGHGTLWHELIHAFADANTNADLQQWFSEGFASFYEMAFLKNGKVDEGYTNWRIPQLHEVIRNKQYVPLKDFMRNQTMNVDFGYSEARFIFCYLWINNQMETFVNKYLYDLIPRYKGEELGLMAIKMMEKLIGKNIDEINAEYISFAKSVVKNQKLYQKKNNRDRQ